MRYDQLEQTVLRHLGDGGVDVVSFDVFDTLVQRRCTRAAIHDRVLTEMLSILSSRGIRSAANAHAARALAVQELCADADSQGLDPEFHVADLYQRVLHRCAGELLSAAERDEIAARLVEFEIDCERRAIRAVPGMLAQLEAIRGRVRRMIFVSDMYLGTDAVDELLAHCGYGGLFDAGYTSGSTLLYKSTGRAFHHVLDREGVDPDRMLHVGDHEIADDRAPRDIGIRTERIVDPLLDRIRMHERLDHPFGVHGAAVAVHAWTDAGAPASEPFETAYGRKVLGPIFGAFVHRVMESAIADGVDALYFLSRDGFVPMAVYEAAAASPRYRDRAPGARYLAVSRLPTVRAIMAGGFSIKALMSARNQLVWSERTVRNTLRSLDVPDDTIEAACSDHGVDADRVFDDALLQHPALLSMLNDARVMQAGHEAGSTAHALLIGYLEQEGFFDHDRVGLVDIGWGGTIQDQLHDALQYSPDAPQLIGYYFGGNRSMFERRTAANRMDPLVSSVFNASGDMLLGNSATFAAVGLLEEAARASHGTCTGYRRVGAVVDPVFKADEERLAEVGGEATLIQMQRGIVDHATDFFDAVDLLNAPTESTMALGHQALQRMVYFPTAREVAFWTSLTHTNDIGGLFQIDEQFLPVAEPWWRRARGWREKTRASMWTQGSVRYLLGVPGVVAYNSAWALSYSKKVQRDLNAIAAGVRLHQPHLPRHRSRRCGETAETAVGPPTSTTALYEANLETVRTKPTGEVHASTDIDFLSALPTVGTILTVSTGRLAPARLRGGIRIVNDGLPIGLVGRRLLALRLATPITRSLSSDRRSMLLVSRVLRRALRC